MPDRRHHLIVKDPTPAARWVRDWVPQENAVTGKKYSVLKWVREDRLEVLKEKFKEPEPEEPKPEQTTEILFLCSYEGCHKAFPNEVTFRKHYLTHGDRQHACSYPGCGKKFFDRCKLRRHLLVHTGEKNFICTHEGCSKAFSLDFNLRQHMKIHSKDHYRVCPYPDCGKRYTQECKLKSHIKAHHEKDITPNTVKKMPAVIRVSPSSERPYACPYEGCGKDYIHQYKLNLHLKTQHPSHNPEDGRSRFSPVAENTTYEASDQDIYTAKGGVAKNAKRTKPNLLNEMPPAKLPYQKGSPLLPTNISAITQQSPIQETYEEDSDDTDDEHDYIIQYRSRNEEPDGDSEETQDEGTGEESDGRDP